MYATIRTFHQNHWIELHVVVICTISRTFGITPVLYQKWFWNSSLLVGLYWRLSCGQQIHQYQQKKHFKR